MSNSRDPLSNHEGACASQPGEAFIQVLPDPVVTNGDVLLKVRMVGFCGSDLNSFRGFNPLVSYPRILGHEVSATVVEGAGRGTELSAGADVALFPYTSCGKCASCRRGRPNACQFNQTLGVQRDGAVRDLIAMPQANLGSRNTQPEDLHAVIKLFEGQMSMGQ